LKPEPLHALEGTPLSGPVLSFAVTNPLAQVGDFSALIDWGDGKPATLGSIRLADELFSGNLISLRPPDLDRFVVSGSHVYDEAGSHTVHVIVKTKDGSASVSVDEAVTVDDYPLALTVPPSPVGQPLLFPAEGTSGTLSLKFQDPDPNAHNGDYTATIDWGDKTMPTNATISGLGIPVLPTAALDRRTGRHTFTLGYLLGGLFALNADHAYAEAGNYTATVTVKDDGTGTLTLKQAINVPDAPLTVLAEPFFTGQERDFTNGYLATIQDGNPHSPASDFTGVIHWGDGKSDPAALEPSTHSSAPGAFDVVSLTSAHVYASAGKYFIQAEVDDRDGSVAFLHPVPGGRFFALAPNAIIGDGPLTNPISESLTELQNAPFTEVVAKFIDQSPDPRADVDFTGAILWGDGASSAATFKPDPIQSLFPNGLEIPLPVNELLVDVIGTHTYQVPPAQQNQTQTEAINVTASDPGGSSINITSQASVFSLAELSSFTDKYFDALWGSLDDTLFGNTIPFLGSALKSLGDAGSIVKQLKDALSMAFTKDKSPPANAGASVVQASLQQVLFDAFGPGGLNLLQDLNSDGTVGLDDIGLPTPPTPQAVEFHIKLHKDKAFSLGNLNFDLGLPGVPLSFTASAGVNLDFSYTLDLTFGFFGATPFFVDPSSSFQAQLGVTLASGFKIQGTLGFLQATVQDGPSDPNTPQLASSFNPTFTVNIGTDPTGVLALTKPNLQGEAKINLFLTLGFTADQNQVMTPEFPQLDVDLRVDWSFNSADTQKFPFGSVPMVTFKNVALDLGSFFTQVITPIINDLKQFTGPLEPLAQLLLQPVPVLNDINVFANNPLGVDPAHGVDVAFLLGTLAGTDPTTLEDIAQAIDYVNNPTNDPHKLVLPSVGQNLLVPLGQFSLMDPRAMDASNDPMNDDQIDSSSEQPADAIGKANSMLGGTDFFATPNSPQTTATSNLSADGNIKLDFPILDDPTQAFALLMGHDVQIFTLSLSGCVNASFTVNIPIPVAVIGGINLLFSGNVGFCAAATLVYDTSGFRTGNPLAGLSLQNASVTLNIGIGAGLGVEVAGFGINVLVGLNGAFTGTLLDGSTGSTTIPDSDLESGNVAFNLKGSGNADIEVDAEALFFCFQVFKLTTPSIPLFNISGG
jgi:hypothetical protein